jgi:hypothetical protein
MHPARNSDGGRQRSLSESEVRTVRRLRRRIRHRGAAQLTACGLPSCRFGNHLRMTETFFNLTVRSGIACCAPRSDSRYFFHDVRRLLAGRTAKTKGCSLRTQYAQFERVSANEVSGRSVGTNPFWIRLPVATTQHILWESVDVTPSAVKGTYKC